MSKRTNLESRIASADALIFDCDGTLVDTVELYCRAWQAGFADSGYAMARSWYLQRAGMSEHALLDAYEQLAGRALDQTRIIRVMRAAFRSGIESVTEIQEVAKIVRQNFQDKPMAVASGGPREVVESCLRAANLRKYFDVVVTIDDVAAPKPAPDLFLFSADRLGVRPAGCLVFEDSSQGLEAAHRAGMSAIDIAAIRNTAGTS